jgi:hypothetical protein
MVRGLSLRLPLSALAASAALAGCGAGAVSTTTSTPGRTDAGASTSTSVTGTGTEREPVKGGQSVAKPLTLEEMREYDANEGRCHDDGGSVRDVGTVDAYCAFPTRSNDFHLIESSKKSEVSGEEE